MQQAYQKALDHHVEIASVICDDTYVLILPTYFYWKLNLSSTVYMQGVSTERNIFDIRETVTVHKICKNTGFHGIVFSRIRTESTIVSLYGWIRVSENPYSHILYAAFEVRKI